MDTIPEIPKKSFLCSRKVLYLVFVLLLISIWGYSMMSAPTNNISNANRQPTIIHVAQGESLAHIASEFQAKNIVRHANILKTFTIIFKLNRSVDRGDYLFDSNVSVWRVAWMLARGEHHIDPVKVTFKEGITNEEMAKILSDKLSAFRKDLFLSDPRAKQGYLFPDTYFFFPLTTSSEILSDITSNFNRRIAPLKSDIENSGHSERDIIVMASLVEKEASGKDDAPTIAGILWKRIKNGMPLQVDASKETYTKVGLPESPIANPGLVSINAAIHPIDSPYLYYLHDKNGNVHYAKTFPEHKSNIAKYLK